MKFFQSKDLKKSGKPLKSVMMHAKMRAKKDPVWPNGET